MGRQAKNLSFLDCHDRAPHLPLEALAHWPIRSDAFLAPRMHTGAVFAKYASRAAGRICALFPLCCSRRLNLEPADADHARVLHLYYYRCALLRARLVPPALTVVGNCERSGLGRPRYSAAD